ncbi:MAG TPA: serine/threonine-protein kinase [Pseudonocardiaceae bacterium]|jgi:serine/threonine-protein kinase|nr:serine/threonine-protein kinase [Pseudonocardiaceae bacterium]
MTLTSGQLLAQRYRLSRRIAIGGMGEVWEAADTRLGRQVAVKVLKQELSGDVELRRRFHAEARMTASLNHPGIAAVHDYGETGAATGGSADPDADPNIAYLVMELVTGDPLATILTRHPRLPADRTLDILGQAATALQAAHERGLVHRDVKPGNILITPAGKVKLTDFGIARAVDAAPVTRHGMVMGTAHYIAPEQAAGDEAGPAGDVYSLAVVGYECLAGRRPFQADNAVTLAMMHIRDRPPPLPPDVPSGARALIEATMVKDPRQRYGTGAEFAAAVAAVRAGHRLPPPGMAGGVAGGKASNHPPPTALLPPQLRPGRNASRTAAPRVAMALLGVLVLVFSGYLVNEALGSNTTSGSNTASPQPGITDTIAAPAPVVPQPFQPIPTEEQRPPEPTNPARQLLGEFIVPRDYVGKRGSDAVIAAKNRGLDPEVLDEDGQQIDRDRRSQCRVIDINPQFRFLPRGSTLELICRGADERSAPIG